LVASASISFIMGCAPKVLSLSTQPAQPDASASVLPLRTHAVDKLDLLFVVDNSAGMGDKQMLLAAAIPDMITRLVTPNCVDTTGAVVGMSDQTGACTTGTAEFPPVHDMHIGLLTSSLGGRGGNECSPAGINPANPTLNAHEDDRGELIARGGSNEVNIPNAGSLNFLAWFPTIAGNAGTAAPPVPAETSVGAVGQPGTLVGDFTSMVLGVNEHGCSFAAPDEAWYRFLVQPDPFDQVALDGAQASLVGVDQVILQQRAAFLRPESLLAVIVVTDEDEKVANPVSFGGGGWQFETNPWPNSPSGGAPEGTIECTTRGPEDPNCASCSASSVVTGATFSSRCPNDPPTGVQGYLDPTDDEVNVRFFNQKQRFGVFAGYPISRYTQGLQAAMVPDRAHEVDSGGNYVGDQATQQNCVNPIFAMNLPTDPTGDLCHLTSGPRTPGMVFYAALAGVPHQLLQATPGDPECPAGTNVADCPQKAALTPADWTSLTGANPAAYNFDGIDFHMLESIVPRTLGNPYIGEGKPSLESSCPPGSDDQCDPLNGREWITNKSDLQFACIFHYEDPETGQETPKDCTLMAYAQACDCAPASNSQDTPLCAMSPTGTYTTDQIYGKAYPSIGELAIAHAMAMSSAGDQGIVSSVCPIHTHYANGDNTDPLYGYRPAMNAIVEGVKSTLNPPCLPPKLTPDPVQGTVPCLLLVTLPIQGSESLCNAAPGMTMPSSNVLTRFQADPHAAWVAAGGSGSGQPDPTLYPTCVLSQLTAQENPGDFQPPNSGCSVSADAGWCYVEGAAAGSCPQQILFTAGEPQAGATASLVCNAPWVCPGCD
jgi:hypothetical protein